MFATRYCGSHHRRLALFRSNNVVAFRSRPNLKPRRSYSVNTSAPPTGATPFRSRPNLKPRQSYSVNTSAPPTGATPFRPKPNLKPRRSYSVNTSAPPTGATPFRPKPNLKPRQNLGTMLNRTGTTNTSPVLRPKTIGRSLNRRIQQGRAFYGKQIRPRAGIAYGAAKNFLTTNKIGMRNPFTLSRMSRRNYGIANFALPIPSYRRSPRFAR